MKVKKFADFCNEQKEEDAKGYWSDGGDDDKDRIGIWDDEDVVDVEGMPELRKISKEYTTNMLTIGRKYWGTGDLLTLTSKFWDEPLVMRIERIFTTILGQCIVETDKGFITYDEIKQYITGSKDKKTEKFNKKFADNYKKFQERFPNNRTEPKINND